MRRCLGPFLVVVFVIGLMLWIGDYNSWRLYHVSILKDDKLNIDVQANGDIILSSKIKKLWPLPITISEREKLAFHLIVNEVSNKLTSKLDDTKLGNRGKKIVNYARNKIKDVMSDDDDDKDEDENVIP